MHLFSKKRVIALFMLPTLLLFTIYVIIPVIVAFYYSFTDFSGIGNPNFIGFKNYGVLFGDKIFYIALKNSGIVLAVTILVLLPGSFFLALLLNRNISGSGLVKALNFSPNIISPILVGLIWVFILDPHMGLINALFRQIGWSGFQPEWIGGKTLTPYSVAFVYVWQVLGYNATIFLAGLKMVPQDVYEASEIDGASKVQQLRFITIPMIRQSIIINTVLIITGCFKIFETVYQLTNGGPNHLSDLLVTYMYFTTFNSSKFGYGMSIASITFLISLVFSVVYLLSTRQDLGKE